MENSFFVTLQGRGLIHIEGPDRKDFLQGLITNDIEKAAPDKLLYACLLTPQGKFLHDFFIHDGGDFLLLDCEGGPRAEDLFGRLNKYRLRANVQISFEKQNDVYAVFTPSPSHATRGPLPLPMGEGNETSPTKQGIVAVGEGLQDPRHFKLGFRTFEKPDLPEELFTVWDQERIILGLPDGSRDMIVERSTLLECNLDQFNAIDFDKGCYVGQELTARMHHRGLAKKHLYAVKIEGPAPAPFTDLPDGGSMRSACGEIGLALLKDDIIETMKNGPITPLLSSRTLKE